MKASNANKVISVLLSVAMCPMMVPSAAFAAEDDAASDASSPSEQTQPADQAEGADAGASSNDTITPQSEAAGASTGEAADPSTGEAAAPVAGATVNGYPTLEEAVQKATVDAQGAITYEVTGKVNVDSTGWVQVRPAAATNAKVVKFVGKGADAEICITQGVAILADQGSSALSVEFSNLKLSKLNPTYAGDYGQSTNYFTTWLRNTDAASNCVTYTNCEFPNGVCNNQYGKTVFNSCTFTNTVTKLYNMWVYGGNVEVKGGSFTGVRGLKVYTEGTATVAPKVDIAGASFAGVSEKAAIVVSKPATVTLSNVSATDCAKGLIQKDIEGSSEEVTLNANGSGIGGNFDITANTGSDATKAEFNLNAGTLTSEVSSDFLADGFTLSKSSDGTFGVAEAAPAGVAEVNDVSYASLQAAIDAAPRNATVKLLADTKENVTISTPYVTLDLNGYTLNGGTEKGKPALTVTARVTVKDSSEAKTGTIMREDTAENSGVSSHYVIDIQGSGWLTFESGNVTNNSGNESGKGASLVRVGDDSVAKYPGLNIKGGNFTQNNFVVIKVDSGDLFLNGGTLNSTNSYAIENWHRATVKGGTVNGAVAAWTYSGGHNSDLAISGGTVNGDVKSVTYDGAEGKTAKVSITGGTVNGTLDTVDYSTGTTSNDPTKATIEVTGGTFSTDPSRYLVEGSAATPNGDGTFGVAKAYLAQVGETSYYTMDEATKAQTASGEAITLLRDYTTGSTFNSGSIARVVDLNGHTWTCTGTDANSAAFEINYSNASLTVKNGKVVSSQLIGLIPSAMGGTITYDNSTLTFEGVEASTTATSGIETNGNNTNDTVVLKNSTLNVPNGFGIYFPSSGKLTIDNSTINAKTMGAQVCSGNLNVTAGSAITVSGDPVEKLEGDGAIQDGAAISIVNRLGYKGLGQIAITGGTFTAKGDNTAIKAYTWDSLTKQESAFDNSAKTVAVSGGTFSSAVSADLCAEGYAPVENDDDTYGVGIVVAEAAGKQYASLYDAVHAVKKGGTVKLLADAESPYTLVCSGKVTFELGEYTITNTNKSGIASVIKATNGAVVTVNATTGGIDAGSGATNNYAFYANSGTVIVNGGNYTVGLDKNGDGNSVAYADKARQKGPGTIRVNGGTFEAAAAKNGHSYVLNAKDNSGCTIEVKGGTFKNFDPSNNISEGEGTNFVPAGYAVTAVENGSDTLYTVSQAVAQIGTKAYANLQAAIDAAQDGETVTLLTDVVLDAQAGTESTLYPQFTISGKKLTLDMQGHKISYSEESRTKNYGKASLLTLSIDKGSDVTITGNGTIDTELGSNQAYGINILGGSNLTIDNGTFYGAMTAVQVQKGGLVINDGTFLMAPTCKEKVPQYAKYIINCIDAAWKDGSATVSIKGGTFGHDYSHSPEGEGTSYLAPGYAPVDNGDGTYGVVAGVAQVAGKAFNTLQAAINAAESDETIQLLNDTTENVTIAASKQITLDLNGHTLNGGTGTAKATILNKGNVTITDTSADKTGTIKRDDRGIKGETSYYVIHNIGTMVIDQANVANNSGYKKANSSGSMVGSSLICNGDDDPQASLTINGGTFKQPNFLVVKNGTNGTLTVNGGTLTSNHSAVQNWNKAQILGGSLAGQIWTDAWVEGAIGETIIGGDAEFTGEIVVDITGEVPPTLKIEGGKLDVTKWTVTSAAAAADATIAVSGGTFMAAVPENYCAEGYVPATNADGTYGVAVGKFTVQVTSRTTTSGSPVANVSGGGSDVTYAEGTTVTASAISGYKFVGWFVNEYAGTPYSTDLTCTVKPTDNCTMIAVYEPVSGGKFWLSVAASEFTVNGGAVHDSYLYEQYAIGASVTVNFTGTENFLYWVNASNKVVSTDKSYTFTMGSETALKAVYGKARQNQATVVFISHSDQIISSKAYTTSDTIQFPMPPIKMGCTFTGWSMTEAEIHEAMANNGGIIQVRALYTEPSIDCAVTVVYPDGTENEVVNAKVGQLVNVTAKDIEGKTFSCWTDNDGNVLGYTKTLKLAPSGNMTVKAIYSDEAAEAKPVISISEVSATKANEGYVVTFMATRAVPEGYQVVKQGILWSRDAACGGDGATTYMQFDSNGKLPTGVNAYIGNSLELNGVTRLDITTKYNDRTFYGRGYMILKSDAGELLYIYTDTIASGSYDSLTK